jgi:hypothetical protein
VFILVGLLLLGLAATGLVGLGLLAFGRRPDDDLLGRASARPAVLVGGGIVLLAVAAAAVALVGIGGGSDEDESSARDRPAPSAGTVTTPEEETEDGAAAPSPAGAALGPVVPMAAAAPEPETFPRSYEGVDELEPNTVLRLRVEGFEAFDEARAWQCVTNSRCGNAIDVQFGADGTASFQYLVLDDFAPTARQGQCRARAAPCSIVVEELDGERRAEVQTVFHDVLPPPGRIRVTPRAGLVDGQAVTVEVENYPPGAAVQAMLCAAPDATGTQRCGTPGPTAAMTVGPDGTASTTLTIRAGPVGSERVPCGPDRTCGVSVASQAVFARAPVVPIGFAAPPGAHYDPLRLGTGLWAAALLLGFTIWLVRRTDWSPIGEEAAPEIDNAHYADLDALVASLPPEDDPDERSRTPRRH